MIIFDHALDRGGSKWLSTWIVGKQGMVTGYVAARLNARPVSTGSRIRAATSRLVQVVQGRRRPLGCATFGHQSSEPLNGMVVALADHHLSRAEASAYSITSSARASSVGGTSRPIV